MKKLKELIDAIIFAHENGDKPIGVVDHGSYKSWNPDKDSVWQKYWKSRGLIASHKILEKVLTFFHVI